jgi:hypothetical protein
MVDQCGQIVDEAPGPDAVSARLGRREAAMREGDAGVALAEMGHLLPPREMVAAEPVGKDERGPWPSVS